MKKAIIFVCILAIGGIMGIRYTARTPEQSLQQTPTIASETSGETVIAHGLDTPWAMGFLPDGTLLVTERPGRVRRIDPSGTLIDHPVATLPNVKEAGEGGLLGLAIHPTFTRSGSVYLYYTYSSTGNATKNRVVRMTYRNESLQDEKIIVDAIPGAPNHNGGRIKFGPDGFLYITTGDAQEPSLAQDTQSLAGKILRVTDNGTPAPGNPFSSRIYSYGHRNPQGLAWDKNGALWSTEHGPSGLQSGNDEINKIEPGTNYGWPTIQGTQTHAGMVAPYKTSGSRATWAPGGATVQDTSLFFTGLRGASLYQVSVADAQQEVVAHFTGTYGRIRDVITGPDGMLYVATSNQDGRGNPDPTDDRIIRIHPNAL